MNALHSQLGMILGEWFLALGVIVATAFVATTTGAVLRKILQNRSNHVVLRQFSFFIPCVIYLIGIAVAIEVAPFSEKTTFWLNNAMYVISILILSGFLQKASIFTIEWTLLRTKTSDSSLSHGFIPLIRNVVTLFVLLSGCIMVLKHFNYDVMSLVTALGVGSLAVGLAAKDTLSNMISGFILIIDRNLSPGDRITIASSTGDVEEIGLRSTRIKTTDGNTLVVPNSELVNNKLLNLSLPNRSAVATCSIRVPHTCSFPKIKSLCLAAISEVPKASRYKPGWVNLTSLSEGHQLIQIGFWVDDMNDQGAAISDLNERLLRILDREMIPLLSPLSLPNVRVPSTSHSAMLD